MESFGQYLKGLREEAGKSIEEIAANTKIAVTNLEFLEQDRYDLLPPRVFVKGFIRSYVQELGLNADESIGRFDQFTKEGELPDYEEEEHPVFHQKAPDSSFINSSWFTLALTAAGVISIIILLLTGVSRVFWKDTGSGRAQPSVKTVQPSRRSAPGIIESSRSKEGKKVLEIKALANTWIRVEPDGGPAEELVMAPGDVQIFTAKESFHLQTGNAGGIRLTFDGRDLPTLGKANQTLSLSLP
ncbi:MAG: RodZ domain-containing protein [Desulfomonilaceae bacterium]